MDHLIKFLVTTDMETTCNDKSLTPATPELTNLGTQLCTIGGRPSTRTDMMSHILPTDTPGKTAVVLMVGARTDQIRKIQEEVWPEITMYQVIIILLTLINGVASVDLSPECRKVGNRLVCDTSSLQDKVVEEAEVVLVTKSSEFQHLQKMCKLLEDLGFHDIYKRFDEDHEIADLGSLTMRGCLTEIYRLNSSLPMLSPALSHFLSTEGLNGEMCWLDTELGPPFAEPVPLERSHRLDLTYKWLRHAASMDQSLQILGNLQGNQTVFWDYGDPTSIAECLEFAETTGATHVVLVYAEDQEYHCTAYQCTVAVCQRTAAEGAAIITFQTDFLYGGVTHLPRTRGVYPPIVSKFCKFDFLNEVSRLSIKDHQDLQLAGTMKDGKLESCRVVVSTAGEPEAMGSSFRCLALRKRPAQVPIHEACVATHFLTSTPIYQTRRRRRGWGSFFSGIARFAGTASQYGSRIASGAARAVGGAARNTGGIARVAQSVWNGATVAAKSIRSLAKGTRNVLKTNTGKLIGVEVLLGVGLATGGILHSNAQYAALDAQTRMLEQYMIQSYNHTAHEISEITNLTVRLTQLEPAAKIVPDQFFLPSLRPGEALMRQIEFPTDLQQFLPPKHKASFAEIDALQSRLWEVLKFYMDQTELLRQALAGEVLLPGISPRLQEGEQLLTFMLEDRCVQRKLRPQGVYVHTGEAVVDLAPLYQDGWLRRLRTQSLLSNQDPCRPQDGGRISIWCFVRNKVGFHWSVELQNVTIDTIFDTALTIVCRDGNFEVDSGRYTVIQKPKGCTVLKHEQYAGSDKLTGRVADIHIITDMTVDRLGKETELSVKTGPETEPENETNPEGTDLVTSETIEILGWKIPYWILYLVISLGLSVLLGITAVLGMCTDCCSWCALCMCKDIRKRIRRREKK